MLTGPEVSPKLAQGETTTVQAATSNALFAQKKGDLVAVCHVPPGNDAHDAIYMEVGAKSAAQHVANHEGDREVALGAGCDGAAAWIEILTPLANGMDGYDGYCGGLIPFGFGGNGDGTFNTPYGTMTVEEFAALVFDQFGAPPAEGCSL